MKQFVRNNLFCRVSLFLGLSLLLCATIRAQQSEQRVIRTMEELTEALAAPSLRSDEPVTYTIVDAGIAVKQEIPVGAGKYILNGGPLYRSADYNGYMLNVNGGGEITIQNTIKGGLDAQTDTPNVLISNGRLILGEQGVIRSGHHLIWVIELGEFVLNGGNLIDAYHTGIYTRGNANVQLLSGHFCGNMEVCLLDAADETTVLYDPNNVVATCTPPYMQLGAPLRLMSSLTANLNVKTSLVEGDVLVQSTADNAYQLTASDVEHISLDNDEFVPKLQGNQIVLAKKIVVPDIITTEEELQAAIDAATGTIDHPTAIKIAEAGIHLAKEITVGSNKHVLLTGGTIKGGFENTGHMFTIENGGSVTLREITIDGGCIGQEKVCWGFSVRGGTLTLEEGATLKGFGLTSDVSVVAISGGLFVMSSGLICDNFFLEEGRSMCSIVAVGSGSFIMNGGEIVNNRGDDKLISLFGWGTSWSSVELNGGVIAQNGDCYICSDGSAPLILTHTSVQQDILLGSAPQISNALDEELHFRFMENMKVEDGFVVLKSYQSPTTPDCYQITQADVDKIKLPEGYTAVLQDNQVVVKVGDPEPAIDLQVLIDAAEVGTLESPSEITLIEDIVLTKTVEVKGKHIKLTGGKTITAPAAKEQQLRMFRVTEKGSLTLDNMTLDGTAEGYVSFATVEEEATLQLINGTTLQHAKTTKSFYALSVSGNLVMDGCTFAENINGEAWSAIGYTGSHWICKNSVIRDNVGYYKTSDGKTMTGYVFSAGGQSVLQQCEILNNEGYAIHATNIMNMSQISWQDNSCDIMLVPASLDGHERTYVGAGGEPTTMATIGEYGVNHLMFSDKVGKKIAVLEAGIEGCVIAEGYNDYQLTEEDLNQFVLDEYYEGMFLALEDNRIVLHKEANVIDTEAKLQAAIDASKGTAENPEEIRITGEIAITSTIQIVEKHVRLTGGTLKKAKSVNLNMLYVQDGTLKLTNIILDGAQDEYSGYCSFLRANSYGKSVLEIGNGAKLTNALGGNDRENYIVCANAELMTLNGGEITGNFVKDGAVVFVDWSGNFVMNSGSIVANQNVGNRYKMSVVSGAGEITLNGGIVSSSGAYSCDAFYLYGSDPFILGENAHIVGEINMYNNRKITIASALVNPITFSFFSSNQPTGTIVAVPAEGYTLTENDLSKVHYAISNVYGLRLQDGNIVAVNLAAENKTFNVKVADCAHGTLSVNKTTAKENEEINVTAIPEEGYKLYSLVYNETNELAENPAMPNTYTFKMPPMDATISAQFIKDNTTVNDPETEDPETEDPDAIRPGKTIDNLDDLIDALNGGGDGTTEITPETTTPTIDDDDPINDKMDEAAENGNVVIGSIEELINVLNKDASGGTIRSEQLTKLPAKITLRLYLPSRLLTAVRLRSTASPYYILNQCDGEVTTIETEYDAASHSVTFETDRLGIFVVVQGTPVPDAPIYTPEEPMLPDRPIDVANAEVKSGQPVVYVAEGRIVIEGLRAGKSYAIYDLSGRILKNGVADGLPLYFLPSATGNYVIRYDEVGQVIHFEK